MKRIELEVIKAVSRIATRVVAAHRLARLALVGGVLALTLNPWATAQAQSPVAAPVVVGTKAAQRGVSDWLMRMHDASRERSYVGTFVVSAGGHMSSARIWHVCSGGQQMERVESLTGAPRSTFRRDDQVITFMPDSRVAVAEKRESLGLFPNLLHATDSSIAQFYRVRAAGRERVAGFESDVVQLQPADRWRFGYRIWTEQKTGLVVKLQTLDGGGQVLEQAAFSELQLDAPVSMATLSRMMANTDGYQVERPEMLKTTSAAEGWLLRNPVPGFKSMNCFRRTVGAMPGVQKQSTFQWIFSDGLASVSLFVDVFDPQRHSQPGSLAMGATHTLTQRMGGWWLTAVGEVPSKTLAAFAQALERQQ